MKLEQVILVGHSAGGLNVTDATYKFPNKISLVVYLAATMLKSGFLTEEDVKDVSFLFLSPLLFILFFMSHIYIMGYKRVLFFWDL